MNRSTTIIFYIYLLFSSYLCAIQYCPTRLCLLKHIEPILSINPMKASDQQLQYVQKIFEQENVLTCTWFKDHKKELKACLQETVKDVHIKLFGSRKWET